jgi:hypothetical protein
MPVSGGTIFAHHQPDGGLEARVENGEIARLDKIAWCQDAQRQDDTRE